MKTYNKLFDKIISFENLLSAAHQAAKGKRSHPSVISFFEKLEDTLYQLQNELQGKNYKPGEYTTFHIYDPKPRLISAAPFRDRVVHHALMNIVAPLLERSFIFHSYANRRRKGTHRAIRRYQNYSRQYDFVLKCDIKKYFPSIDHAILKSLIRKRIACQQTLWLIDTIIDGSNPQEKVCDYYPGDDLFTPDERRKGLPIGNLTSQFFANYYLNLLDHFIKEQLRCKAYLRYVDDFDLFSNAKQQLWDWKEKIMIFLYDYRLNLHPTRCQVYPTNIGYRFLGQIVFKTYRLLPSANVRKFKKRLKQWSKNPPENQQQRIASWVGHASQANTFGLLKSLGLTEKGQQTIFL